MRKLLLTTAAVAAAIAGAFADETVFGTLTDTRDGQTYKTVTIGKQTWMAENLNYKTDSSWCYKNADSNCVKYGRLYNWYAAMSACPSGWYLPTKADWREIAGAASRGYYGDLARLKAVRGWNNNDCYDPFSEKKFFVGNDEYGFCALPGGERSAIGEFVNIGLDGYWWTSTEGVGFEHDLMKKWMSTVDIGNGAYRRSITHCNGVVGETGYGKGRGYSVRCIQGDGGDNGGKLSDSTRRKMEDEKRTEADQRKKEAQHRIDSLSDYFTDSRDGRIYRTVTIGGKTWMAQNLNYKTGKSWCYNNDTS
ncbi:MAG: hypothetical protein LBC59_08535, partial [Chitinispirillales bacterium]|nr:hypothetical protein [Chitinispirillales bacterium]